jgi:hypothetical protein
MHQVADLVGAVFADEIDADGRRASEMQTDASVRLAA